MRRALSLLAVFALATGAGGCAAEPEPTDSDEHPAITVTVDALETRMSRSTDPEDYASFFDDEELAEQFAASAEAEAEATSAPLPEWEPPFVAWETSAGVAVVVVWDRQPPFRQWPPATRLDVQPFDGDWLITDAFEMTEEELVAAIQ